MADKGKEKAVNRALKEGDTPNLAQSLRQHVDKPPEQSTGMAHSLRQFVDGGGGVPAPEPAPHGAAEKAMAMLAESGQQVDMMEKVRQNKLNELQQNIPAADETYTAQMEAEYDTGPPEPASDGPIITDSGQLTEDFHTSEFACKGTGQVKVSSDLVNRLQQMRDYIGKPIIITSGYRAPEHNATIQGAAPNSRHMSGEAADIQVEGMSMEELAKVAKKFFGDGGIGTYSNSHIHVDVGGERRW